MYLTIIGATGATGRAFVEQSLARGHTVTALARSPEKLQEFGDRIRVARADGRDAASLMAALTPDMDVVVNIVGASGLLEARRVTDLYSVTAGNLVTAMRSAGIARIVAVSSGGVAPQPSDNWFYIHILKRFFLEPMYADMRRMEAILTSSGVRATIVRPPYLTNGKVSGRYRTLLDAPIPDDKTLHRADLAHFLLRVCEEVTPWEGHWVSVSE